MNPDDIPPDFFNEEEMEQYRKDVEASKSYEKGLQAFSKLLGDAFGTNEIKGKFGRKVFVADKITKEDILNCDIDELCYMLQY